MPSRAVSQLVNTQQQREGGGFIVRRVVGSAVIKYIDPFVMLDHLGPVEYGPGEAIGAPDHPHRGFDIATYVLDGEVEHKDSAGNTGVLKSGWVQWMTTGRGVVHSEMPTANVMKNGGKSEGFQLWINLPKSLKMSEPQYQDTSPDKIPVVQTADGKVSIKVIAGEALGSCSPIETKTKILMLDCHMKSEAVYEHPLPKEYNGFVYCYKGEGLVGSSDAPISVGQIGVLSQSDHGDSFRIKSKQDCGMLLICGEPINEPIVHQGPFVMNTMAEIEQAITDYKNGTLGSMEGAEARYRQTDAARQKQKETGVW